MPDKKSEKHSNAGDALKKMATPLAPKTQSDIPMLAAFARMQISADIRRQIEESTFLELATCAYFCGAEAQIRKQSQLDQRASLNTLIAVIMDICNVSRSKTIALINAIYRLAAKYYLLENIFDVGKIAADQWLNCRDDKKVSLQELVRKYRDLTMFDLGIEGVNNTYNDQQQALYASVEKSVTRLRRRTLLILLIIAGVVMAVSYYLRDFLGG